MIYNGSDLKNISFPLGGIGTGCIGLAGNGELIDWEIFNRPSKNTKNGYSHFSVSARTKNDTVSRVLHSDTFENLSGVHEVGRHKGFGYGVRNSTLAGFPHFKDIAFDGSFPMARLSFIDDEFPAGITLTAFNPLIPHNAYDSSLPVAFFEWNIENTTDGVVEYSVALSARNPSSASRNEELNDTCGFTGIKLYTAEEKSTATSYFDITVLTDSKDSVAQEYWYRGGWMDSVTMYWNNFTKLDRMPKRHYDTVGNLDHCTLASYITLQPHSSGKVRFVIAWNAPNQYNYWSPCLDENGEHKTWRNYYATQFKDSYESAKYALGKFDELKALTESFTECLHSSTLPSHIVDAVSSNLSVLKSPTVLRLEDGSFWGWEGCSEDVGSCEGSCQHVWNYAYALPFLFPELERSLRENTVKYALKPSGATVFRVPLPLGRDLGSFRPCVDGQMGEVIKCYREWKISGDDEWLREHAEDIFRMLEFAFSPENEDKWDADADGVMEGRQHHTLDMELFGPSSWLQGFYLLALDCGARIATALGEAERAEKYKTLYKKGVAWTNDNLFNGKYFIQKVDLKDRSELDKYQNTDRYWNDEAREIKYQIADGCIIDQMLSDWHAAIIGLPGIFDKDNKRIALENLFKNNFKTSMRRVANMWRNFAVNDEGGTVICSYPEGSVKQAIPIPYCEECMTGFEYSFAGLLATEGYISECETAVKAIRDRYDGNKRNPWNEIECGSNYARSMASFALLPIYSGFSFDMTEGYIGFDPISKKDSNFLFSIANSWGSVAFENKKCTLTVKGNSLALKSFGLPSLTSAKSITVDGERVEFTAKENKLFFPTVTVKNELVVEFN